MSQYDWNEGYKYAMERDTSILRDKVAELEAENKKLREAILEWYYEDLDGYAYANLVDLAAALYGRRVMSNVMRNTCEVCGGPTRLATDTYEQSCASCNRIAELEAELDRAANEIHRLGAKSSQQEATIAEHDKAVEFAAKKWAGRVAELEAENDMLRREVR